MTPSTIYRNMKKANEKARPGSRIPKEILKAIAVLLFWLIVWEAAARLIDQPLFLPRPGNVFRTFVKLFSVGTSYKIALFSLLRVLGGFSVGMILGIVFAVFSYYFPLFETVLSPVMTIVRSTPVASFIMLLWLVIGRKNLPTAIGLLMVLPLIYGNILAGLRALSPELSEVCRLYRFSPLKRFRIYVYPGVMPYFAPATVNALGLSWKAGIAAEVLAQTSFSLGKEIYLAKSYLEAEELYAWTIAVILLSLFLETLVRFSMRRWLKGEKNIHA